MDSVRQTGSTPSGDEAERRNALTSQLERLRDLYVMGDLTKPEYIMRRQALEEELQRTKPPTNPDLARARAILEDFTRFWDAELEPAERRKLILSLFEQVWQKDGQIVAVKPNHAFASYFTAASEAQASCPKAEGSSEATKAGATGRAPASVLFTAEFRPLAQAAKRCAARALAFAASTSRSLRGAAVTSASSSCAEAAATASTALANAAAFAAEGFV